jgi:N-acyl-D-amino-acid deacylase
MQRRSFLAALGALPALYLTRTIRASQAGRQADVLLRNGRLCDGTDVPLVPGGLALRGNRIVAVGDLDGWSAPREIDVRGQVIAPGFIDVHSHAGQGLTRKGLHTARPLLAQGITTILVNPDGGGPLDLTAQADGYRSSGIGVHVAQLIGHGTIRRAVLSMDDRAPSPVELDRMRAHVRTALDAGAIGLSSGLFYAPGFFAKTDELVALMDVVGTAGGVHTSHIRDEGTYTVGLLAAVDEIITIAEATATTGVVSHMKALGPDAWGLIPTCIERIEAARRRGVRVFADQYPYEASSTSLAAALLPRAAQAGGADALASRLADPAGRQALLPAVAENIRRRGGPASLVIAHYPPEPALEGQSLGDVAASRGAPPEVAALDLIAVRDVSIVSFNMSMDDIDALMTRPWTMTSSDGAIAFPGEGRPHPRGNGAFTRKLTTFVRDRQLLRLPEALQTMTRLPANVFGLTAHGRLEPGAIADVVVFALAQLEDRASYMDPHQIASGMSYVFVDGVAAIDEGRFTDALAGRVLRRQPDAAASSG